MQKLNSLLQQNQLFDSHCHLNDSKYDSDLDEVINRAKMNEISSIFDISTDYNSCVKSIELSQKYPIVYSSLGIDMESLVKGSDLYLGSFEKVLLEFEKVKKLMQENRNNNKIQMIGETGIDNYWNRMNGRSVEEYYKSEEEQSELFRKHIELAIEFDLPLSIHTRDSITTCLDILKSYDLKKHQAIFHSLTPDWDDDEEEFYKKVMEILERGYLIGLNGIITYKTANTLRNTILKILKEYKISINSEPTDIYQTGFVFETDGPFLSPEGKRGKRNEPNNVMDIYEILVKYLNK